MGILPIALSMGKMPVVRKRKIHPRRVYIAAGVHLETEVPWFVANH
jgi:hypothetical protein